MAHARYKQLVDSIADEIRSGRLAPGTRLPTHRLLAAREGLALVTATRVYAELEAMGLVSGETGRGTFVREIALPPGQGMHLHAAATDMVDLSFNYPTLPGRRNCSGTHCASSRPRATWKPCCATRRMAGGRTSGPRWHATWPAAAWQSPRRTC
jgi:DNA-binding transcriptional MocR family regulator